MNVILNALIFFEINANNIILFRYSIPEQVFNYPGIVK